MRTLLWTLLASTALFACASDPERPTIEIVHLERDGSAGLEPLRRAFVSRNPGYDLSWHPRLAGVAADGSARVVLVQTGEGRATVGGHGSDVAPGDVIVLREGESLDADGDVAGLAFHVPEAPPRDVPTFVRPDWDPEITDTPGGCAEEVDAYRRVLLTWLGKNGPYLYRAMNVHRVRITDSFSHYHPVDGGFDEFYLVQGTAPGARLLVSDRVDLIESPDRITEEEAAALVTELPLATGDLVYLPRGTMHRGLGGVLTQVISVPGFVPKAEIGVDHHLREINERLDLTGAAALPFNTGASTAPIVK